MSRRKLKEKKKSERKQEREKRVLARRNAIREEARVKKEISLAEYKNRERIIPIRNKKENET